MIKTVISMILVCAIMVQSKKKIRVTVVTCIDSTVCKDGLVPCVNQLTTLEVELCTESKITVLQKDSETDTDEYEHDKCYDVSGISSMLYKWTDCKAASDSCNVSNTVVTGVACDCSGNDCTDAQFCYDDVCNSKANANSNAKVATTVLFSMVAILFL